MRCQRSSAKAGRGNAGDIEKDFKKTRRRRAEQQNTGGTSWHEAIRKRDFFFSFVLDICVTALLAGECLLISWLCGELMKGGFNTTESGEMKERRNCVLSAETCGKRCTSLKSD